MTVEIREQGPTDTEQLKAIIDKLEEIEAEFGRPYNETKVIKVVKPYNPALISNFLKIKTKEYMKNYVERKTGEKTENYVAADGQKVVGFLGYWEPTSTMFENGTQLDMIFVDLDIENGKEIEHELFRFYSEMEECYEP